MEKVLVTGGLGFIGHHLVNRLIENGRVVYLVDDMSNAVTGLPEGVESRSVLPGLCQHYEYEADPRKPKIVFINSDFAHENLLKLISSGAFQTVFHLAAKPRVEWSVENPILSTNENFTKVLKLAKSCADGKSRLVFSSTAAVYGDTDSLPTVESTEKNPQSPYGLSKYCVEQYLALFGRLYSLDWAALRYFNVYGPAQPGDSPYSTVVSAWCTKALNNEPLRSDGDGNQTRDMVHVDDVVSANIIVANTTSLEERIFNVGSGKAVSNNQIRQFFVERGYDQVIHAETRKGDVRHTLSDTSKLEKLGWNCIYSFSEGIKNVLNYWKL